MRRAAASGATVLPVDSEHNAVFQSMSGGARGDVRRIIITASGGPFRTWSIDEIRKATVEQALKHPNWSMGPKITIDSASMMNKGLEIIEAHHLFDAGPDEIDVLVHPQSIVHGGVEFVDGSMVAQIGPPDMRVPIAHCLAWPARMDGATRLSFDKLANLTFEAPDETRFPALRLAKAALRTGQGAPTALNAANEIAVAAFLDRKIGFPHIAALVEAALEASAARGILREPADVDEALAVDHTARSLARDLLPQIAAKAF
jgi:1-deoxy-D-xylulose-5-phosphate reductoisomerase